jgi:aspartyl-tRNA(Asn)/glutamyl-tRNA(Gln) amidotransferase subunit C
VRITREEVRRVAELARLEFSPEEQEELRGQLDRILEYVGKLEPLDTSATPPLAHVIGVTNVFRDDRVVNQPAPERLLANAPEREKTFFKVPKIIE